MLTTAEMLEILDAVETDAERVLRWRIGVLLCAGYDYRLAFKLALRPHVDLHEATGLVRRGCPPDTAARILV